VPASTRRCCSVAAPARHLAASGWTQFLARLVVALGALCGVLFALAGTPADWLAASLGQRVARLAAICAAGAAAYFAALWLLGFRLRDFNRREDDRPAPGG
jgi:putative peptidoglycan lipid II flippase